MSKKIFAFLLAAVLVLAAVPALAEEANIVTFGPNPAQMNLQELAQQTVKLFNLNDTKKIAEGVDEGGDSLKNPMNNEAVKAALGEIEEVIKTGDTEKLNANQTQFMKKLAELAGGNIFGDQDTKDEQEKAEENKKAKETVNKLLDGVEEVMPEELKEAADKLGLGDLVEKLKKFDWSNLEIDPTDDPFDYPETVTLSYDPNGDNVEGMPEGQTHKMITSTTMFIVGKAPTREGYTFKGWNTSADGSGFWTSPYLQIYLSKDATLYAMWEEDEAEPDPTASHSPSPKTGDTAPVALCVVLMAVSALALVAMKRRASAK